MSKYLVSGIIMLESTRKGAYYEFEMEWYDVPNEMDILMHMMQTGEIQIIHGSTREV